MKKYISPLILFIVMIVASTANASSDNKMQPFLESAPDSVVFNSYLDTIKKYVYLDSRKIPDYVVLCEKMIAEGKELSNANRLNYVIQSIYHQYTLDNVLEVSRLIASNRSMLELRDIPMAVKKNFIYLDGYTSMVLGDHELAQQMFYELLDEGIAQNDTSTIMQATQSLGLIYRDQKDFKKAESYFLKVSNLARGSRKVHLLLDLVDLFIKKEDLNKAEYYNRKGLSQSDSLQLLDFHFDFMLRRIIIHHKKGEMNSADKAYELALDMALSMKNSSYLIRCKEELAGLLNAQGRYAESFKVYEELIEAEVKGQHRLPSLLRYYQSIHLVAEKINLFEKAYTYLSKSNETRDSLAIEEQRQKSEYLKIKFEADQKEKENVLLTAQVLQKKSQNQLLYALATLFFLFILFLFGMVLQKREYNSQLKREVKNRTIELEQSNKLLHDSNEELSQLTNILSHDLREPLRSIVGFSTLAEREAVGNEKLEEYLEYINKGGRQLYKLIESVNNFRELGLEKSDNCSYVDISLMINKIMKTIEKELADRNVQILFSNLPTILTNEPLLIIVFKNLIENGIKYNENDTPTLSIRYEQQQNNHCFLFQDNGIGIPEQYHEYIFGMFKRLNNRMAYEGSGLGLNMVKKIINSAGGDVGVRSSMKNQGSLFQVIFPIMEEQETNFFKHDLITSNRRNLTL